MSEPLVCCVMLVNGREAMVRRAIASFRAQTYGRKRLLVFDTGRPFKERLQHWRNFIGANPDAGVRALIGNDHEATIGGMRNHANRETECYGHPEIIAHWDSDDWSHPQRLAEQVALLQAAGADVVGYNTMLFWREPQQEAWLYTASRNNNRPVGTSLMYWRHVWAQHHFADLPKPGVATAEDTHFLAGLRAVAVPSVQSGEFRVGEVAQPWATEPRMIASIHGGNTSPSYQWIEQDTNWVRAPQWTDYCRDKMRLEVCV